MHCPITKFHEIWNYQDLRSVLLTKRLIIPVEVCNHIKSVQHHCKKLNLLSGRNSSAESYLNNSGFEEKLSVTDFTHNMATLRIINILPKELYE